MPTYEYRCKACGHQLEIVQAFSDDALTTCPSCDQPELRKVFGAVGISFKGSGFYKNDSRRTSSSTSSSSSSSTSTTTSSGAEGNGKSDGAAKSGDSASSNGDSAASAKTPSSAKSA
ncbi:MAG: FmdB family zinc ribbon protein [Actinomycetota bacterium]